MSLLLIWNMLQRWTCVLLGGWPQGKVLVPKIETNGKLVWASNCHTQSTTTPHGLVKKALDEFIHVISAYMEHVAKVNLRIIGGWPEEKVSVPKNWSKWQAGVGIKLQHSIHHKSSRFGQNRIGWVHPCQCNKYGTCCKGEPAYSLEGGQRRRF